MPGSVSQPGGQGPTNDDGSTTPVRDSARRAAGVLLGLAAGDRIGGPLQMTLRVAESLRDCASFELSDIADRYLDWWREGAFDTGPTTAAVLSLVTSGVPFAVAAVRVDDQAAGMTAGCNPAHRIAPLAMCAAIPDTAIVGAAMSEARLTHKHPLAGDVAAAVARLCRALVRGAPWPVAVALAAENRSPETRRALTTQRPEALSRGGYAPAALGAAVQFVSTSDCFATALHRSIDFAGPANYCAVLAGSIGGARWGSSQIDQADLEHHGDLVPRLTAVALHHAMGWRTG